MACAALIGAWQPVREDGPLKFTPQKEAHLYKRIEVPCGTCILCREAQARDWTARLLHQAREAGIACMITLTYDEKNEPEHRSLDYADLQKFWKRLRRAGKKFQYYAVGEYGDRSMRPHYHACVFGEAWLSRRIITKENPRHWTSLELEQAWGKGIVDVTPLNEATAAYAAGYVLKKLNKEQQYVRTDELTGELIPIEQPRSFMSRNLGRTWWDQFHHQVENNDFILLNGSKVKPPRAHDRWLREQDEERLKKIKERRRQRWEKDKSRTGPEQMRAHARNAHARAGSKRETKSL